MRDDITPNNNEPDFNQNSADDNGLYNEPDSYDMYANGESDDERAAKRLSIGVVIIAILFTLAIIGAALFFIIRTFDSSLSQSWNSSPSQKSSPSSSAESPVPPPSIIFEPDVNSESMDSDGNAIAESLFKKISLNGQSVPFPFSIDDLNGTFVLSPDRLNDERDEYERKGKKGERKYAYVKIEYAGQHDGRYHEYWGLHSYRGVPLEQCYISNISSDEYNSVSIEVDGISRGSTLSDVESRFGRPTDFSRDDKSLSYTYGVDYFGRIQIRVNAQTKLVDSISISYDEPIY